MIEIVKEYIQKYLLIEATRLADGRVHIMTLEYSTAQEMAKGYDERLKWEKENAERLQFETEWHTRVVCVYNKINNVQTYQVSIDEIKKYAEEQSKNEAV